MKASLTKGSCASDSNHGIPHAQDPTILMVGLYSADGDLEQIASSLLGQVLCSSQITVHLSPGSCPTTKFHSAMPKIKCYPWRNMIQ